MNKHAFIATSAAVLLGFAAVLSLGLTPVRDAGAGPQKVKSPCDKDGAFSPKVDKDLLRKDLVIEPAEMPGTLKSAAEPRSKHTMLSAAFVRMRKPAGRSPCQTRRRPPEISHIPEAMKEIRACRGATSDAQA